MFCCPGLAVRREDSVLAAECTSPHSPSPGLECISCSPLLAASHPSKPLLAGLADELCTMFWLPSTLPDQFSAKMSEMLHLHPLYPGKYLIMIVPYFCFKNRPFSFLELTTSWEAKKHTYILQWNVLGYKPEDSSKPTFRAPCHQSSKGRHPEKSWCSFGFCPNYLPPPSPNFDNLYNFFWTPKTSI